MDQNFSFSKYKLREIVKFAFYLLPNKMKAKRNLKHQMLKKDFLNIMNSKLSSDQKSSCKAIKLEQQALFSLQK